MFDVYCTHSQGRVLLSNRSILSLHNASIGRVLYYRCACEGVGFFIEGTDVEPSLRRGTCTGPPGPASGDVTPETLVADLSATAQ